MLWEELSAANFLACVKESEGVCVVPLGVIEKHGDHLPLGTDMYTGTAVAKRAAELAPAVVFPYYFLGQIAEARHVKGTLAASHRLMMDALLEMCDEIHRNGFTKILILSSHGGNAYFLPFFAQQFPGLNRPYAVYVHYIHDKSEEQTQAIQDRSGVQDLGQHAGFLETSVVMHLRPDLVRMELMNPAQSASKQRLKDVRERGVITGFNWYAEYPHHFAGDPSQASAEHGKFIFDMICENTAEAIRAVKADGESLKLIEEYNKLGK